MKSLIVVLCALQLTITLTAAGKVKIYSSPAEQSTTNNSKTDEKHSNKSISSVYNSTEVEPTTIGNAIEQENGLNNPNGPYNPNETAGMTTINNDENTPMNEDYQWSENADSSDSSEEDEDTDIFVLLKPLLKLLRRYYSKEIDEENKFIVMKEEKIVKINRKIVKGKFMDSVETEEENDPFAYYR